MLKLSYFHTISISPGRVRRCYNGMKMPRLIGFIITVAAALSVLVFAASSPVRADDLSSDQIERIKTNCVSIKSSLSQLHVSDALLRVNRGQIYESMGTNLMDAFNGRLGGARLDNKAMVAVTEQYRTALADFRADYIAYEQKLSTALKIDCRSKPQTFHNTIGEARELRKEVYADIQGLHRVIDDYRSSVGSFLLNFERVSE